MKRLRGEPMRSYRQRVSRQRRERLSHIQGGKKEQGCHQGDRVRHLMLARVRLVVLEAAATYKRIDKVYIVAFKFGHQENKVDYLTLVQESC